MPNSTAELHTRRTARFRFEVYGRPRVTKQFDAVREHSSFGIRVGDQITINPSRTPEPGHVVLVDTEGGCIIARLTEHEGYRYLITSPTLAPVLYSDEQSVRILGVVTHVATPLCA